MQGLMIRKPRQWLQTLAVVILAGCFYGMPSSVVVVYRGCGNEKMSNFVLV